MKRRRAARKVVARRGRMDRLLSERDGRERLKGKGEGGERARGPEPVRVCTHAMPPGAMREPTAHEPNGIVRSTRRGAATMNDRSTLAAWTAFAVLVVPGLGATDALGPADALGSTTSPPDDPVEIVLLGTSHFAGSALDEHSSEVSDVLSEERQAEFRHIAARSPDIDEVVESAHPVQPGTHLLVMFSPGLPGRPGPSLDGLEVLLGRTGVSHRDDRHVSAVGRGGKPLERGVAVRERHEQAEEPAERGGDADQATEERQRTVP